MHSLPADLPCSFASERLQIRCYQAGDGPWYYAMSQRNKAHLARYESGNAVMAIDSMADAEAVVRDFAAAWAERRAFFAAAFLRNTQEFTAQMYIGVANRDLPELEIGYFADVDHQGRGYVTEATRAALRFAFRHLGAYRVRLECDDTNVRSYLVAERCGMVREGHIRENKKNADGSISGTLHYGLLRREWLAAPGSGEPR